MAQSTCVKCGNKSFEFKEVEVFGSNYKKGFIQCASCGGVVGVVSIVNTNALIRELAEKLGRKLD